MYLCFSANILSCLFVGEIAMYLCFGGDSVCVCVCVFCRNMCFAFCSANKITLTVVSRGNVVLWYVFPLEYSFVLNFCEEVCLVCVFSAKIRIFECFFGSTCFFFYFPRKNT